MNINRHNYEEFFLLYVDDELTHEQRRAVERFVASNADLARELEMLLQTKLPGDTAVLPFDKSSLFKTEEAEIDLNNYEEYFLLYIDNELTQKEKASVEKFVTQHAHLQPVFELLQQTTLQPETISFANKEILYRTEEKERRVIPIKWTRIAVAAAVAGIMALAWWVIPAGKTDVPVATVNNNQVDTKHLVDTTHLQQPNAPLPKTSDKELTAQTTPERSVTIKQSIKPKKEVAVPGPTKTQVAVNTQPVVDESTLKMQQPVKVNQQPPQEVAQVETTTTDKQQKQTTLKPLVEVSAAKIKATEAIYAAKERSSITQPAIYKEIDTQEDDRTLYVGSMQLNKDKVRGLLKKATRLFGSKAKNNEDEDGKLQVANFELETRNLK